MRKGPLRGMVYAMPLALACWAGIFSVAGCVTTQPSYEVCDTPNCGDNVVINVVDE